MKRCQLCNNSFSDENEFCVDDGSVLTLDSEAPRRTHQSAELPTQVVSRSIPVGRPSKASNWMFLLIGILATGLVAVLIFAFFLRETGNANQTDRLGAPAANTEAEAQASGDGTDSVSNGTAVSNAVSIEAERLAAERTKLEAERKRLEQVKQSSGPLPPGTSAMIIDPPTNIRVTPNGKIICVIPGRQYIGIINSPSIATKSGNWYRTNACGQIGLVHSSQVSFR